MKHGAIASEYRGFYLFWRGYTPSCDTTEVRGTWLAYSLHAHAMGESVNFYSEESGGHGRFRKGDRFMLNSPKLFIDDPDSKAVALAMQAKQDLVADIDEFLGPVRFRALD